MVVICSINQVPNLDLTNFKIVNIKKITDELNLIKMQSREVLTNLNFLIFIDFFAGALE